MATLTQHADNIVLGNGELHFDKFDEDGNKTGERYLGQTPEFTLSVSSEVLEKYSSDGPIAELLVSVTTQITREGTIVCDDISDENIALFFAAEIEDTTQTAGTGTTDTLMVVAGRAYQLGQGDLTPFGALDVSNVVATATGAAGLLVVDEDYTIDEDVGRIVFLEGGAIGDTAEEVTVAYDSAAVEVSTIHTTDDVSMKGALRFVSFNAVGEKLHAYMPNVTLAPDGDMQFNSRDDFQQIGFNLTVQAPNIGEAIYFYRQKPATP